MTREDSIWRVRPREKTDGAVEATHDTEVFNFFENRSCGDCLYKIGCPILEEFSDKQKVLCFKEAGAAANGSKDERLI